MTDKISETHIKSRGSKIATFALLFSCISLASSGYLYYLGLQAHTNTVYQLQSLNYNNQNILNQNQQLLSSTQHEIDTLKDKVNNLSNNKFNVIVYQINTLVNLANQSLIVYHDIAATIKLLDYTQNILSENNNAAFTDLKLALNAGLSQLQQLPVVDKPMISGRLNGILDSIEHLELIAVPQSSLPDPSENSSDLSKWQEFLLNVKLKLFGLVQVSHTNTSNALNLLPQHEVIVHQNIKLDMLNARMALLQNDEVSWQYNLNDASQILSNYFTNNTKVQQVISEIGQLKQLDISTGTVNLDQTIKALNKLNSLSLEN